LIVSAATINDLGGWMLFAVVLGLAGSSAATGFSAGFPIWAVIVMTLVFVSFMLTVGRWLIHQVMPFMQAHASWPAGVLSLSLSGAFACAALTEHIGLHAIFGAFIFGVAFGDTPRLRERVRETLDQFISFIFAPLFFASIGLQMDFAAHFDLLVVSMVLVLAVVGKVAGCYLGGLLGGLGRRQSLAVGFAENARGAMEIILGLIALRAGIIDERLFVALVVMALVTSMSAGWLMIVSLNRPKPVSFVDLLSSRGFVTELASASNVEAIGELSQVAAGVTGLDAALIRDRVWEREQLIPTGLPGKVAIPHARIDGLSRPCLVLGRSEGGVDFDAPDGHAARLVFLILTPGDDTRSQLEIISGIAREFSRPGRAEQLARNRSFTDLLAALKVQD
jgi:mannitol/fructose-specific phosphotransferase system IIA component (Ntr-type)